MIFSMFCTQRPGATPLTVLTVIFLAHSRFVRLRETNIFMLLTVNLCLSLCLCPFVCVPLSASLCPRTIVQVHPSLVINMDQTGVHLVPVDNHTYEAKGSKDVKSIGGEDKRQITLCVASSLNGDMLPLQLIFTGTTQKCLPQMTEEAKAAAVHLTHSENHWSSQATMQQYVKEVIIPYAKLRVTEHNLPAKSHIVLVLDVWSVHKSKEFIAFLKEKYPRIHLVFVPANCTSKLQVADVMLQRPFKHGIKKQFNEWAARKISEQITSGVIIGLAPLLKMGTLKPLVLQWCINSWKRMQEGRDLIKFGWHMCCISLFDVMDTAKCVEAMEEIEKLDLQHVPSGVEANPPSEEAAAEAEDDEEESKKDELDVMKERKYGTRRGLRKRPRVNKFGGGINPCQIDMAESGEDTDANGMS